MDTTFTDGITLTAADWFNDINRLHYTILGDPADAAAVNAAVGGLVLLSTSTASSSATLTATLPSTYGEFEFVIHGLTPATNAANLLLQYSTDGGSSWVTSGYQYIVDQNTVALTTPAGGSSSSASSIELANSLSSAGLCDVSGAIVTSGINSALFKSGWLSSGGTDYARREGYGNYVGSTANAMRLLMSSGNIASGVLRVWGKRK